MDLNFIILTFLKRMILITVEHHYSQADQRGLSAFDEIDYVI
tara:strand:+ start:9579 stop:9704 length:126 start_codon:yes stop_codon:yes gene_type:complete